MAGASFAQVTSFMLDADISIYALNGVRRVEVALREAGAGTVGISTLVYSQLLQGVPNARNPELARAMVAAFLAPVDLIPYDATAALAYGEIIAIVGFSRRDVIDRMIAAHAISLNATLVTNNVKDFADIPGLKLTNWAEP